MFGFLRRPRWVVATGVVIVLAILFVNLGLWQLRRNGERRTSNEVYAARVSADPVPLPTLLEAAGPDPSSLEYRRATVTGRYAPSDEVLLRGQAHEGVSGFDVVTPLVLDDRRAVLVDRGWVPLAMDTPPVPAAPAEGEVEVTGVVRLTRTRAAFGPVEPEGRLSVIARIDVPRLDEQITADLYPVWLEVTDPHPVEDVLPIPVRTPTFDDPGPHLSYAIQWFSFALIGVVGYIALILKTSRTGGA